MRKFIVVLGCLISSVLLIGTMGLAEDNEEKEIIAKVGDQTITLSDLEQIIGYLSDNRQAMIEQNPQVKESILRQYVQSIVISQQAKKEGFDKKPEVSQKLNFYSDSLLSNLYLEKQIGDKVTVTEEEIKAYYDEHRNEFTTPEMVKARHILVKVDPSASEEEKKQAYQKAEDILKQVQDGKDFAELATELSDDSHTQSKGGDLGFFSRGKIVKPFEDVAFAMKPGETSGIVETQFGYHIIRVEDRKEETLHSYDSMKERIQQRLLQQKKSTYVNDFIDKAMQDAKAELYPEKITEPQQ